MDSFHRGEGLKQALVAIGKSTTYNPRQTSCHTLQNLLENLSVHPLRHGLMLFVAMKLSLLVYNIVGGQGGCLF